MTEIRVPTLGELITEATVGKWFKQPGDAVAVDEPLVELETDKVTLEVPAPAAGVLGDIAAKDGDTVAVGALLGQIKDGAGAAPRPHAAHRRQAGGRRRSPAKSADQAVGAGPNCRRRAKCRRRLRRVPMPPSVRKLAAESGVDPAKVDGSGMHGQVTKGDMMAAIERAASAPTPVPTPAQMRAPSPADDAVARRARAHDAAAPDHRAAAEGRAEHRRHAHDLQRGRHGRGDGHAQSVQGAVREEARGEARLHGLLRARLHPGLEGNPRRQRRDRRHRHRLQELLSHWRRRRHREGPGGAGGARRRHDVARRHREDDFRFRQARARRPAQDRGACRAAPSRSPTAASTAR